MAASIPTTIKGRKQAIGYIRVSHEEQARDGLSLEMQDAKIHAYCHLNDLDLIGIVEDAGISAKNIHGRPGFQQALDMVFGGRADALVVWKLDRAFRSTQDALTVAEKLNKRGKALVSICENLPTRCNRRFFFTPRLLAQRNERSSERHSRPGAKRCRGEKTGGSLPYGFIADEHGKLAEHPEEQSVVSRIRRYRAQGYSYRKIVATLARDRIYTRKGTPFAETQIVRILNQAA